MFIKKNHHEPRKFVNHIIICHYRLVYSSHRNRRWTNLNKTTSATGQTHTLKDTRSIGRRRLIGSLIFIGHFPQKWPISSGSFVEYDLQLRGPYESSPPCTTLPSPAYSSHLNDMIDKRAQKITSIQRSYLIIILMFFIFSCSVLKTIQLTRLNFYKTNISCL